MRVLNAVSPWVISRPFPMTVLEALFPWVIKVLSHDISQGPCPMTIFKTLFPWVIKALSHGNFQGPFPMGYQGPFPWQFSSPFPMTILNALSPWNLLKPIFIKSYESPFPFTVFKVLSPMTVAKALPSWSISLVFRSIILYILHLFDLPLHFSLSIFYCSFYCCYAKCPMIPFKSPNTYQDPFPLTLINYLFLTLIKSFYYDTYQVPFPIMLIMSLFP